MAKKTRKAAAQPAESTQACAPLKLFHDGAGHHENFGFARAYWPREGERESILDFVGKKMHPWRSGAGAPLVSAAKVDLVLPPQAPQDYMDIDHLVRRYEETLPAHELSAFAQVTLRFPGALNLHQPWEMVRAWARGFYGDRLPVILVLHAPHLAGSANPGHVHCIVLPRQLGPLGWTQIERLVASDEGQRRAHEAWSAFREDWQAEARASERP